VTCLVFVVSCSPCKEFKPKHASKTITGKREAIFKVTENCLKSLTKKQNIAFFSKITNADIPFWAYR